MSTNKISVCLASYNGEKYIKEQIESILAQLKKTDELIVSDDGSTDETINILRSFNDQRLIVIKNNNEKGYTRNFENALSYATGEYFFLSDQDDVWLEGRIEKCMKKLEKYNFVMTDGYITDSVLVRHELTHFEKYNVKQGFWNNLLKTRYVGAFMAFDKSVYDFILPFPSNQRYCPHDYWITVSSEFKFKCRLIKEPYVLYRRHGSNLTGDRKGRTLFIVLVQRFYTLSQVLLRSIKRND